jgi:hypothetical protein
MREERVVAERLFLWAVVVGCAAGVSGVGMDKSEAVL